MDDEGRLVLSCIGTIRDLEKNGVKLTRGLRLGFYNEDADDNGKRDDLVVEGIVDFNEEVGKWVARIAWDDIKNISRLSNEEKERFGFLS